MRLAWPSVAGGTLVLAVGAAGLIRGAMPQDAVAAPNDSTANPITVTGAYVRPPLPPTRVAGAYFTVHNNTDRSDTLVDVQTGAGAQAEVHRTDASGAMIAMNSVTVPAHGTLVLAVGKAHVMISQIFGTLQAGSRVDIALQFRNAGPIDFVAPVVPYGINPSSGEAK